MGKWSVEGQITGVWRLERIHEYSLKEGKDVIHNGSFMGHFIHEKNGNLLPLNLPRCKYTVKHLNTGAANPSSNASSHAHQRSIQSSVQ